MGFEEGVVEKGKRKGKTEEVGERS